MGAGLPSTSAYRSRGPTVPSLDTLDAHGGADSGRGVGRRPTLTIGDVQVIQVHIEETAPAEQSSAVKRVFADSGLDAEVTADYGRRSLDVFPWAIIFVVSTPLRAFFQSFGSEGGKDAYAKFKEFMHQLRKSRSGAGSGSGTVDVSDPDGTRIIFGSELPDEAIEALANVDWDAVRGGYIVWNNERQEWYDHLPKRRD
jgi:hypothetical protein